MSQKPKYEFRLCRDEDKPAAAELAAMEDFERLHPDNSIAHNEDLENWNLFYHVAEQAIDECSTIVAAENERLIGIVNFSCSSAYGNINYLYVLPEWRQQGVGGMLLRCAEDQIASSAIRFARVLVDPHDSALISFCESLGYSERQLIMKKRVHLTEDAFLQTFDSLSDGSDDHE